MKTYSAKPSEITKKWFVVDATDVVLGRLASEVAKILRGKHKPTFTPHMDCGDNVIIINAEKVRLTGKKLTDKKYWRHTGYPGGIKFTTPAKLLGTEDKAERVIKAAVKNMVGRGPMARERMRNLKIYVGNTHEHEAQKPTVLDIAAQNPKNKRVINN